MAPILFSRTSLNLGFSILEKCTLRLFLVFLYLDTSGISAEGNQNTS